MTAAPMTLEEALDFQGFTIDPVETAAFTITVPTGTIHVPDMITSKLTWRRDGAPSLGDDLYLSTIPVFAPEYKPILLSQILDRYRTRRLGYDTPGQWRLAFRRWCNLNMTVPNLRYLSTAVTLPLDDLSETDTITKNETVTENDTITRDGTDNTTTNSAVGATSHELDIGSDFPQALISTNTDYASTAADKRVADNSTATGDQDGTTHSLESTEKSQVTADTETENRTGRHTSIMTLLAEQRDAYLNVDLEVVESMESLFFGVFDQGEGDPWAQSGIPYAGLPRLNWLGW